MAMVDLAIHDESGPTKIQSIADRQDIPKKFLEQVLLDLKKGDLVGSSRGKEGGYYLDRTPESVTVLEILERLEESVSLIDSSRDRPSFLDSFWGEKSNELRAILEVSLSELVKRKEQNKDEMMYHI